MNRLRWRVARWLVGPFVNIPERDGVWVIQQIDGGRGRIVHEADRFRMRISNNLRPLQYDPDRPYNMDFGHSRRSGRFVGTVKP